MAGHYESALAVTMGTTLGMLAANVPVVMFGQKAIAKMPVKYIHIFAFVIFIAMAAATLLVV
ncbi:MAG: TMEM165/GDT1 family protein [Alphaproteobacteria bacterium]|nr:TMEM165/GDT1 family protein [Alphaproteobacteria bacterium]